MEKKPSQTELPAENKIKSSPKRQLLDDFEDPEKLDEKRREWQEQQTSTAIEKTIIVVKLGEYPGDCQDEYLVERELKASDGRFADIPISRLCDLIIEPADKVNAIVAVALDNGAMIPVNNEKGSWALALPKNNKRSRDYAFLALENVQMAEAKKTFLNEIKRNHQFSKPISVSRLKKIMQNQRWQGEIYWQRLRMEGEPKSAF